MTKVFDNPLISIIIPIYNVEQYIHKCLDSIIHQTYKHLEIILVDDGSPDRCPQICDEYSKKDRRIKVLHKKNGGLSDARNAGLNIAKGEFVVFVDSDDFVELDCIEKLSRPVTEDKNVDMVIAGHNVIYESGKIVVQNTCGNVMLDSKQALEKLLYHNGIDTCSWNKLFKKELFKDFEFPKNFLFEDTATTYKLIDKSHKIYVSSDITYNYILRKNSITSSEFNSKKMDLITVTFEMCDYVEKKYPDLNDACNRRRMFAHLSTLSQMASSKRHYYPETNDCLLYVKQNSKNVLKNKKLPKRDKVALILLKFGYPLFVIAWNLQRKWSGRA